jgi:hypothetical protein
MILEIEDESRDFTVPTIKITPQTDAEIFEVGIIAGELKSYGAQFTMSNSETVGRFLRMPLVNTPAAKGK